MELKPGYKQTEVGVIPDEWEVRELRSVTRSHNSGVYKSQTLYGHGCNIVGVSDIYGIDKVDGQAFAYVPLSAKERAKHTLHRNDLVYGESSLVREGIARTVYVTERGAGTAFAWHTRRYSVEERILMSSFLYYYLQSRPARAHMVGQSIQTAITGINTGAYFACRIAVPPFGEQKAIAEALSDVDEFIESLEQLLRKKRRIKQGTMQELLTGKRRLPGFSVHWELKRLGEVGRFSKGSGVAKDESISGSIPCVRYGEIYTRHHDYVKDFYSWISRDVAARATRLMPGDILFAGSGETKEEIGKSVAFLNDVEAYAGGDIVILRPASADSRFLGFYLNTTPIRLQKASRGQGDAVVHISAAALAAMQVSLPPLPEQTAIASVISDVDGEITGLEAKLGKARALKQGMMQQLLTGAIRLPLDAAKSENIDLALSP